MHQGFLLPTPEALEAIHRGPVPSPHGIYFHLISSFIAGVKLYPPATMIPYETLYLNLFISQGSNTTFA
jgi:hypothetical protein